MAVMPLALIPFLLLAVPIAEIAAFILVGREIGVGWTLALILVTAVVGTLLLRVQGLGLVERVRSEVGAGRVPARELVHGVMLLVAGVLLLTPGFITDTLGFLLFVPPLRDAGWRFLRERVTVTAATRFAGAARSGAAGPGAAGPGRRRDGVVDLDEGEWHRTGEGEPARSGPAGDADPMREPHEPMREPREGGTPNPPEGGAPNPRTPWRGEEG